MTEAFKAPGIGPGERRSAELGLLGSIPFGMDGEFRYRVQGSDATASATAYVPCVVPTHQAQSALPTLTDVSLTVTPGPLEPGDTVRLSWKAASTTGLWETGAVVSGAFDRRVRVPAAYYKEMPHAVEFVVPVDAKLGEPVRVQVYAVDLLAREVSPLPLLTDPVSDATPPELFAAATSGMFRDEIVGQFGGGDDLEVEVYARDNHELAYLVYEAGPVGATVRDSAPLMDAYFQRVNLRTRPEWAGEGQVRMYVRDRTGNRSRTVQSAPGAVRFFPVRPVTVRGTTLPYPPADFAIDTRLGQLYMTARTQPTLYFHSLATLGQVAAVPLPAPASDLDVWQAGGVLVALIPVPAALAVVDLAERRLRPIVPLNAAPLRSVYGMRVAANGRVLVVGRTEEGQGVVVEYDLTTRAQRVRADAPAIPLADGGVYASLDQSRLLLGAGCVYRVDTDAFGPCAGLAEQNEFGAAPPLRGSGTGAFWGWYDRVFDSALQMRTWPGTSVIKALSADDRHAYVPVPFRMRRMRLADGVVEDALAGFLYGDVRASPDGTLLVSVEEVFDAGGGGRVQVMQLP
jgi:hypothetical protein